MREGKRFSWNRYKLALLGTVVLALLLVAASSLWGAAGAYAELKDTTSAVTETYQVAHVTCRVNPDHSITNTGDIPALIRCRVILNRVNEAGNVVPGELPEISPTGNWIVIGYFYYYRGYVAAGAIAPAPVQIELSDGLQMTIIAEAIQATPSAAAEEAWGHSFNGSDWA